MLGSMSGCRPSLLRQKLQICTHSFSDWSLSVLIPDAVHLIGSFSRRCRLAPSVSFFEKKHLTEQGFPNNVKAGGDSLQLGWKDRQGIGVGRGFE